MKLGSDIMIQLVRQDCSDCLQSNEIQEEPAGNVDTSISEISALDIDCQLQMYESVVCIIGTLSSGWSQNDNVSSRPPPPTPLSPPTTQHAWTSLQNKVPMTMQHLLQSPLDVLILTTTMITSGIFIYPNMINTDQVAAADHPPTTALLDNQHSTTAQPPFTTTGLRDQQSTTPPPPHHPTRHGHHTVTRKRSSDTGSQGRRPKRFRDNDYITSAQTQHPNMINTEQVAAAPPFQHSTTSSPLFTTTPLSHQPSTTPPPPILHHPTHYGDPPTVTRKRSSDTESQGPRPKRLMDNDYTDFRVINTESVFKSRNIVGWQLIINPLVYSQDQ